ncbi:MAG: hypothetical protein HC850_00405 [Rhodomicrobium sp.]|nr:hypothetical protein [Rhodomicrobium sp.]
MNSTITTAALTGILSISTATGAQGRAATCSRSGSCGGSYSGSRTTTGPGGGNNSW